MDFQLSENAVVPATDFQVPEGFIVEEVFGNDVVGSVVAITFDNQGRMVIAKEFGEIIVMIPGQDESYESRLVSDQIINSQGIVYDGPDLLVTAVGPEGVGLYRVVDENGDGTGERVELIESVNRRIEDHGPHAPIWGPDGKLYWIHANVSAIYDEPAPLSPVRKYHDASLLLRGGGFGGGFYRLPEGSVYRNDIANHVPAEVSKNQSDWELYVMGLRNAYDFSFNLIGELFTWDSDHEPDLEMPWFRHTYSYHLQPGAEYGYREGAAVHPEYYFDNAPTLEDLGRGSPTGISTYLSYNYPEKYWDGMLFADWSRGRILLSQMTKDGATYSPESETFVFGAPLNVTDLDIGPDGNMYFTLGGRGTNGGVYRVVYTGNDSKQSPVVNNRIDEVLAMNQPRSSFSRQKAVDIKEELGETAWQNELSSVARNQQEDTERRIRAVELSEVFGPGLSEEVLISLTDDALWEVRATATYYLGMKSSDNVRQTLAKLLHDDDAFVQRRAAEALMRTGLQPSVEAPLSPVEDIFPLLASEDDALRFAGRILLRTVNPNRWRESALSLTDYPLVTETLLAYVQTIGNHQEMYSFNRILNRQLELLKDNPTDEQLLDLVRLLQYTMTKDMGVRNFPVIDSGSRVMGGVIYVPGEGWFHSDQTNPDGTMGSAFSTVINLYSEVGRSLLDRFPSDDWRLNREISRVFAYLQTQEALDQILAELSNEQDRKQQIHYIDMAVRFEDGWTDESIEQVTEWFTNAARNGPGGGAIASMRSDFLNNIPDQQALIASARIEEVQSQESVSFEAGQDLTEEQVESLIFNPQALHGDPSGGVLAYYKAACASCHTMGPIGIHYGPDLTDIGQRFTREDLVRSIVYPSENIADQFLGVNITRNNGSTVTGAILDENNQRIILQIPGGGEMNIPISEIESREVSGESTMPEGLLGILSNQEMRDLILFLMEGTSAVPDSVFQEFLQE
ncbi:MAG: HEAT repeat domain-containing protein [Balneolaceae bacterium]